MLSVGRWIGIAAAVAVLAIGQEASAVPLTLSGPIAGNTVGPQSTSNPCIIAGTQCSQPATMGYNEYSPNNASSYDRYSTNAGGAAGVNVADGVQGTPYTVGQLEGQLNTSSFVVAIDVNTTGAQSEVLQLFEVIINGIVEYSFSGPALIGNVNNNGNGFADWTLGTIDLSGFSDASTVLFHAVWTNAVDGSESFFLVGATPTPVPEPTSLALLGAAMLGAAWYARRRRTTSGTAGTPSAC